jgi:hypothetical protein
MKKLAIVLVFISVTGFSKAQEDDTWRWGIQFGMQGNRSRLTGGQEGAHARFHQNPYGAGSLQFLGRYDYNKHWRVEAGFGFTGIGNEFALSENYSLLYPKNRFSTVQTSSGSLELPVMVAYKFNPNCNNWKWFISAGIANVIQSKSDSYSEFTKNNDGPGNDVYLSTTSSNHGGAFMHLRFSAGKEKTFQSGRMFSWAFIWNLGFSEMSKAEVKYTIDNTLYQHSFSNRGSFFGFRLSYYFKPLNKSQVVKS